MGAPTLGQMVEVHKKLVRSPTIGLRRGKGRLRVVSASQTGLALWSDLASEGKDVDAVVDLAAFAALVKGSAEVGLESRDGRLFVKCGKTKGDLPTQNEQMPRVPKVERDDSLAADDADWLCTCLPIVAVPDLDRTGLLSVACDGRGWRVSCSDDIHGACAFGEGKAKIKFSLAPADADVLKTVLGLAADDEGVTIGYASSTLVVSAGAYVVAIPTVATPDGFPQTREDVESGSRAVAKLDANDLRDALATLGPVATAKDAKPVTVKLGAQALRLSVTSPAGSVESAVEAKTPGTQVLEFRVSYALLSALVACANDVVVLKVRLEKDEVSRITLHCAGDVHLVMLTSS